MARLIKHTRTGPMEVKPAAESVWLCMCGLSRNYPFCDSSHKIARRQEAEGKLYRFEGETAVEVADPGVTREV